MKYPLLIGIILSSIFYGANTMEEKKTKTKYNIRLRGLSQGNSTLPKPVDTPNKRPSPNTDARIAQDAIPRRISSPQIFIKKTSSSSDEEKK